MTFNSRTTRTTPGGSPLIPEEVQRQIVQSVEVESAALNLMPKARMRRAQQRIPVLTQLPTAAWVNGSANLDLLVHNTAWISGHLHLTVGTAATLTYMGITYWLVPPPIALWCAAISRTPMAASPCATYPRGNTP